MPPLPPDGYFSRPPRPLSFPSRSAERGTQAGLIGAEVARRPLSDHDDPRKREVCLSEPVHAAAPWA